MSAIKTVGVALCLGVCLALVSCASAGHAPAAAAPAPSSAVASAASTPAPEATPPAPALPAESLKFSDFFEAGAGLTPTSRVLSSSGKRVRLIGFMARMELPSPRAFYLASRPLVCDESGGGTADLPPDVVRVEVPWASRPEIPFVAGPVQVEGTFDVGSRVAPDGRVSAFRMTLDKSKPAPTEKP